MNTTLTTRPSHLFAVGGLLASLAVVLLPGWPGDVLYDVVLLASLLAMAVGVRRHRPVPAAGWRLIVAGMGVWFLNDLVWTYAYVTTGGLSGIPDWMDYSYLASYPLLIAGMACLPRGLGLSRRVGATLDSAFFGAGMAFLYWGIVFTPTTASSGSFEVLSYTVCDLLVVFMAARMWMLYGTRSPAYLLLGVGFLALLVGDGAYQIMMRVNGEAGDSLVENLGWLVWYTLCGAAALHPSIARAQATAGRITLVRGTAFLLVTLASPLSLLINFRTGRLGGFDVSVQLLALTALLGFLIVRLMSITGVAQRRARELDEKAAELAAAADEQRSLQQMLRHRALHDPLTGLANRALFQDRLDHAVSRRPDGWSSALLLLDLDGFKKINDGYGHPMGDELLVQAAGRLRGVLREADTLARFGGDEFAILLAGMDEEGARQVAGRVVDAVGRPFELSSGPSG